MFSVISALPSLPVDWPSAKLAKVSQGRRRDFIVVAMGFNEEIFVELWEAAVYCQS